MQRYTQGGGAGREGRRDGGREQAVCSTVATAPSLVQLADELIDTFTPIARRAHLLEEPHSILGGMAGHREVERAQE